jgi:membrane protein DedA with SNARE-associated domain
MSLLPGLLFDPSVSPWLQLGLILLGTLASEDLTCIGVGLLVATGRVDLFVGLAGCFAGIVAGDIGLWLGGRLAAIGLLSVPFAGRWLDRLLPPSQRDEMARWLDRGWWAVLAARFLPGTRLPLYLAAGALGTPLGRFVLWTALGALLWVPLVVLITAALGESAVAPFAWLLGSGWLALLAGAAVVLALFRVLLLACTARGRRHLRVTIARLVRHEFWPAWLFYLPLLPWLAWLSLRYRGVHTWTAANPGIPYGGVVGESKFAISSRLPAEVVVPSVLIRAGNIATRLVQICNGLAEKGWTFPLILKPDSGQRGSGVKRVVSLVEVSSYLREQPDAILVQPYHPGPHEAGIFYYRLPDEETGHIFSITDKVFPVVLGDGRSTLEELIWQDPRYRLQAEVFLARHHEQRDRVLPEGQRLPLAVAGNHCQGTLFRDGAHLLTPELERAIDAIAQRFASFYIGRFDVRYRSVEAFKAGRDLAIVELNGVTSESTNVYDPSWSILAAYRTLFRQWDLLYRIGHANRQRGHAENLAELIRLVYRYYTQRRGSLLAD